MTAAELVGTVLAVHANYYRVQLDIEGRKLGDQGINNAITLLCTRRNRLKKIGQSVMVGDRVIVQEPDWTAKRGVVAEVFPRSSILDRPAIANVNQILLVFAVADPPLEAYQLSRFLTKAESTYVDVKLCFNKCDLISEDEQLEIAERIGDWGYKPIFFSVYKGINLLSLAECLNGKTTVLAGASGVGKSSLINTLIPDAHLRVGEVSGKLSRDDIQPVMWSYLSYQMVDY
jgi:ribosome biogenesis GTPase / thiamine phosphate phosphatase